MPAPVMSYKKLRLQLDDLGYYQPLVPEAVPLVEALLHDLLATTHNLKICKEQKSYSCGNTNKKTVVDSAEQLRDKRESENAQIVGLQKKVADFELLYKVRSKQTADF